MSFAASRANAIHTTTLTPDGRTTFERVVLCQVAHFVLAGMRVCAMQRCVRRTQDAGAVG